MASCATCGLEIAAGARFCGNCGDPQVAPVAPAEEIVAELTHGTKLDERYEILQPLGRGGMGVVYLARDHERDGSLVALKLLPAELSADVRGLAQLKREASVAMRLSHPNIVRMHNLEGRTRKYVTMEYVDGGSLADLVTLRVRGQLPRSPDWTGPGLSPSEVVPLLDGIAAGLDYAHAERVIHRDMKPANVMIKRRGDTIVPKVADFGIASELREMVSHVTQKGVAGTPAYMSPEHFRGDKIDARADVYSVAATVYTLLAARSPFKGGDLAWQILNKQADAIPGVNPAVMAVVLRGMSKDARGRYDSCGSLAQAFAGAVKSYTRADGDSETINPSLPTTTPGESQETRGVEAGGAAPAWSGGAVRVGSGAQRGGAPPDDTPTTNPRDPSSDAGMATTPSPIQPVGATPAHEPPPGMPAASASKRDADVSAEPTLRPLTDITAKREPATKEWKGPVAVAVVLAIAAFSGLRSLRPDVKPSLSPIASVTTSDPSPSASVRAPSLGDLINDERLKDAAALLQSRETLSDGDLNDGIGLGLSFFRHGEPKSGASAWNFVISKRRDGTKLLQDSVDRFAARDPQRAPDALLAAAEIVAHDDPSSAWAKGAVERARGLPSTDTAIGAAFGAWAAGDYQAAFRALGPLKLDPATHPEGAVLWCATLLKVKRIGEAKAAFAGLPAAKTLSSPLALKALYETAAELGAWPVALEAGETWAYVDHRAPEGYLAAAEAFSKLGNPARADAMKAQAAKLAAQRANH